jgi:hypothetical protein
MSPARIGWPFAYDWDALARDRIARETGQVMDHAGFDLFSFPSNAGLVFYDHVRFARAQAARGRRLGWRAVLSHQEHFGALAASLIAETLKLPGATPESILAAQHKLHARRVLERVAPEANLRFSELDADYGGDIPQGLPYPSFVKPVKAAFSVLAREAGASCGSSATWSTPSTACAVTACPRPAARTACCSRSRCRPRWRSSTSTAGSRTGRPMRSVSSTR